MDTSEIVTEIIECLKEEEIGRYLSRDGDDARIQFANTLEAARWISDYAAEDGDGASFETAPVSFADTVIVRVSIEGYRELAGL
jgi:hypothetical protein